MRTLFSVLVLALLGAGFTYLHASEGFEELSNRAKAGASEEALGAFVQRSMVAYDLTVDEIFFLSDLGYSSTTISAIVEHGKEIRAGKLPVATEVQNPAALPVENIPAVKPAEAAQPNVARAAVAQTPDVATPSTVTPQANVNAPEQPAAPTVPAGSASAGAPQNADPAAGNTTVQQPGTAAVDNGTRTLVTSSGETLVVQETVAASPGAPVPVIAPQEGDANVDVFYEALQPYGTWVRVENNWLWRPTACVTDPNWRPYSDRGHWVWTDSDWCWQSDYSWGWAPFHYGRWEFCTGYGWMWEPDTCWAPAWVSWRECDSYYGWAPLPWGTRFDVGLGFRFHGQHWGAGFGFGLGYNDYCFCHAEHFCEPSLHGHIVHRHDNEALYHRTNLIGGNASYVDNRVVLNGPRIDHVQKFRTEPIKQMQIADAHIKGGDALTHGAREDRHGGSLQFYRPTLKSTPARTPATFAVANRAAPVSSVQHFGSPVIGNGTATNHVQTQVKQTYAQPVNQNHTVVAQPVNEVQRQANPTVQKSTPPRQVYEAPRQSHTPSNTQYPSSTYSIYQNQTTNGNYQNSSTNGNYQNSSSNGNYQNSNNGNSSNNGSGRHQR